MENIDVPILSLDYTSVPCLAQRDSSEAYHVAIMPPAVTSETNQIALLIENCMPIRESYYSRLPIIELLHKDVFQLKLKGCDFIFSQISLPYPSRKLCSV